MNSSWLLISNFVFVIAALDIINHCVLNTCALPNPLVILIIVLPAVSIRYHYEQLKIASGVNDNDPIPTNNGPAKDWVHCDMAVVITLMVLGIGILIREKVYVSPWLLLILVLWQWARSSDWDEYVVMHSLWHVVAGLVLLYCLGQLGLMRCNTFGKLLHATSCSS